MGKGFPIERAPPSEVPYLFIFATGTGVGPIKALIESQALQVSALQSYQKRVAQMGLCSLIQCTMDYMLQQCFPSCLAAHRASALAQTKERELTRLYYGTFNPEMTAYKNLIPDWQASGVEVRPSSMVPHSQNLQQSVFRNDIEALVVAHLLLSRHDGQQLNKRAPARLLRSKRSLAHDMGCRQRLWDVCGDWA